VILDIKIIYGKANDIASDINQHVHNIIIHHDSTVKPKRFASSPILPPPPPPPPLPPRNIKYLYPGFDQWVFSSKF
jgi:hypothetical protein